MSFFIVATLFFALAAAAVLRVRRGLAVDASGWAPAHGTIADRRDYDRGGRQQVALTVAFSTFDGRRVWFTDSLAAWQVDVGATVPVIYDPSDPLRARVIRRNRVQ
jgi:hypothetical protein